MMGLVDPYLRQRQPEARAARGGGSGVPAASTLSFHPMSDLLPTSDIKPRVNRLPLPVTTSWRHLPTVDQTLSELYSLPLLFYY